MIIEYSKSDLSTPSLTQSYKSQTNKETSTKSKRVFNSIYKVKQKTQQKNLYKLENHQKEIFVDHQQPKYKKMEQMVKIFKSWKTFFIGILIIQFMTQLGHILLQYLDHTLQLQLFLLFTTAIIILMTAVLVLTIKLRFSKMAISKQGEKAAEEFKNEQIGEGRQILSLISQNHGQPPVILIKQLDNMKQQPKQTVENHRPKNTVSIQVLRTRKITTFLTIFKLIQIFAYFTINTLCLTLFIPQQLNKKQKILLIGIVNYTLLFSSLIFSAFFLKKSTKILTIISKQDENQQIFKQKINYCPSIIKNKPQNVHQKIPKFTSINDENFDENLKRVKLIRIESQLTSQNCEKLQNNQCVIKNGSLEKKSALKKLINSKDSSKPSTTCTERRKVQINSKKIQYFQYSDTKSNKKSDSPIKINQITAKDVRLQNLRHKIKSKSKSLEKYHISARKTIRFITAHKSATLLETKANLWKSKQWY